MSKKKSGWTAVQPAPQHVCEHRGGAVRIGPFTVLAGGALYLQPADLRGADVLIPLTERMPVGEFGRAYVVLAAPLQDFGGVPEGWGDFLREQVIPLLMEGKKLLAFCGASHGRTGVFLASLIALLEPETADPIEAVRQRHCREAVETLAQAKAVFALRGKPVPSQYETEFWLKAHAGSKKK